MAGVIFQTRRPYRRQEAMDLYGGNCYRTEKRFQGEALTLGRHIQSPVVTATPPGRGCSMRLRKLPPFPPRGNNITIDMDVRHAGLYSEVRQSPPASSTTAPRRPLPAVSRHCSPSWRDRLQSTHRRPPAVCRAAGPGGDIVIAIQARIKTSGQEKPFSQCRFLFLRS